MFCRFRDPGLCLALSVSLAMAGHNIASSASLSAAQIVDKNVAASGGLQAWRAVQTIAFSGKLGAGGNQRATLPIPIEAPGRHSSQPIAPRRPTEEVQLPFAMELKRPREMRLEVEFAGQTAIQVFDGANGWKLRPFLNRRVVEPYTAEELQKASRQADLDGPLVDYAAKGTRVELDGTEKVEDRDTYKLKLTLKSSQVLHVWIDAETFLQAKTEGTPRRLDGTEHPVEVYFRDYRKVSGLQIPFLLETRVLPVSQTKTGLKDTPVTPEKMVIEKVTVNPKLEAARFVKPEVQMAAASK